MADPSSAGGERPAPAPPAGDALDGGVVIDAEVVGPATTPGGADHGTAIAAPSTASVTDDAPMGLAGPPIDDDLSIDPDDGTASSWLTGPDPATAPMIDRATDPDLGPLELRQIAGLTSGVVMRLGAERYDFSEDGASIGFQLDVDGDDRVVAIPGVSPLKVDGMAIGAPTAVTAGVIDAGSARFLVRRQLIRNRPTDWLSHPEGDETPEPVVHVPAGLTAEPEGRRRRGLLGRRRKGRKDDEPLVLTPTAHAFIDEIQAVRRELANQQRALHPDPAELADQAIQRAPILGVRPPGHPLFAKVGVMVADMPWIPSFDDISAIPDEVGEALKPMLNLPSLPIVADLMVGPLGIVGDRAAALACARHVLVTLYGLSTSALRLHIFANAERAADWAWAGDLATPGQPQLDEGFPIVLVDGTAELGRSGLDPRQIIDRQAAVIAIDSAVERLPSYSGTVLQVDRSGDGLLTNHHGHLIAGTPIGVSPGFAERVAHDLTTIMARRQR